MSSIWKHHETIRYSQNRKSLIIQIITHHPIEVNASHNHRLARKNNAQLLNQTNHFQINLLDTDHPQWKSLKTPCTQHSKSRKKETASYVANAQQQQQQLVTAALYRALLCSAREHAPVKESYIACISERGQDRDRAELRARGIRKRERCTAYRAGRAEGTLYQ